jgi:hypothetical protein
MKPPGINPDGLTNTKSGVLTPKNQNIANSICWIKNCSDHKQSFERLVLSLFTTILIFLFISPQHLFAQKFAEMLSAKAGLGIAKHTWRPYGSDYLKIKGESIYRPYMSISFDSELTNKFKLRKGLSYKMKGTNNIRTRNPGYNPHHSWPFLPNPYYITIDYAYDVLSASGSLLFFPFNHSEGGIYFSTGFGVDYIVSKKPKVHDFFPYKVDIYFDDRDYKRATMFGSLGVGLMLAKDVYLEFEYAPSITRSLNVRQMHINESFFSISLVISGRNE